MDCDQSCRGGPDLVLGHVGHARAPQPPHKHHTPGPVKSTTLGGEHITARLNKAPGDNAPIGGLKIANESGWFADRPSGTENVYKIYAESMKSAEHLQSIMSEAREIVTKALGGE